MHHMDAFMKKRIHRKSGDNGFNNSYIAIHLMLQMGFSMNLHSQTHDFWWPTEAPIFSDYFNADYIQLMMEECCELSNNTSVNMMNK